MHHFFNSGVILSNLLYRIAWFLTLIGLIWADKITGNPINPSLRSHLPIGPLLLPRLSFSYQFQLVLYELVKPLFACFVAQYLLNKLLIII